MNFSLLMLLHTLASLPPATFAGALGVLANCAWPLQRERRLILALQCAGALMFGIHPVTAALRR